MLLISRYGIENIFSASVRSIETEIMLRKIFFKITIGLQRASFDLVGIKVIDSFVRGRRPITWSNWVMILENCGLWAACIWALAEANYKAIFKAGYGISEWFLIHPVHHYVGERKRNGIYAVTRTHKTSRTQRVQ